MESRSTIPTPTGNLPAILLGAAIINFKMDRLHESVTIRELGGEIEPIHEIQRSGIQAEHSPELIRVCFAVIITESMLRMMYYKLSIHWIAGVAYAIAIMVVRVHTTTETVFLHKAGSAERLSLAGPTPFIGVGTGSTL